MLLTEIKVQENTNIRATFRLDTFLDDTTSGIFRKWNERFQIVYSNEMEFITAFTKEKDSSKKISKQFLNGAFNNVVNYKDSKIELFLYKILVLEILKNSHLSGFSNADLEFEKKFDFMSLNPQSLNPLQRKQLINKKTFTPLVSKGRDYWLIISDSEASAHKVVINTHNQVVNLDVVYLYPTIINFTSSEDIKNTSVISLYELYSKINKNVFVKYLNQVRFLMNGLNPIQTFNKEELELTIKNNTKIEIKDTDVDEAFCVIKIIPKSEVEYFYVLSAFNLVNAWVKIIRHSKAKSKKQRLLLSKFYVFKKYLTRFTLSLIDEPFYRDNVYLEKKKGFAIIELEGFQFSFHHFPLNNKKIKEFLGSERNIYRDWKGIRLQPIAKNIFELSRIKMLER